MIPKIIHYCWFGRNKKSPEILSYIQTWKRFCPEYQIIEWNEDNFDINSNIYVKQAYEARKWAFVSDYVRLYVIYNYGGIYMDTDVEVIKSLDVFLNYDGFTGFEIPENPLTGTMGCVAKQPLIGKVLESYNHRFFINKDGSFDMTTNIVPFRDICLQHGFEMNNKFQIIEGFALFPSDYLCAYNFKERTFDVTEHTYTAHHFAGSWLPPFQKFKRKVRKILGNKLSNKIAGLIQNNNWLR